VHFEHGTVKCLM